MQLTTKKKEDTHERNKDRGQEKEVKQFITVTASNQFSIPIPCCVSGEHIKTMEICKLLQLKITILY